MELWSFCHNERERERGFGALGPSCDVTGCILTPEFVIQEVHRDCHKPLQCATVNTNYYYYYYYYYYFSRWRIWWRHRATSRKVAGSIPDYVIGIFHLHNLSGRTTTMELTQPLTEMSTRNIFWGGKGGWCLRLTTLPPSCANCLEIWEPHTTGKFRASPGL